MLYVRPSVYLLTKIYSVFTPNLPSKKVRSTQVLVSKPSNIRNDLFPQKAVFDNRAGDGHFEESCNVLVFKYISMLSKCQSHLSFSILKTGF